MTASKTAKTVTVIAALLATTVSLSSCGNTIRGIGQDTANTVDATQAAGKKVDRAAKY
jgi:entericidin B